MSELTAVRRTAEWQRLKPLVLDSVSSPITKRVYNMALDEFFRWYDAEPRAGFTKATVSAWRVSLEERKLGSSSIIVLSLIHICPAHLGCCSAAGLQRHPTPVVQHRLLSAR